MTLSTTDKKRLAALIREAWDLHEPECVADLIDHVKFRCAYLKLQFGNDELNEALRWVSGRRDFHTRKEIERKKKPETEIRN